MANISAWQSTSNPLTIEWSWIAEANTWWNVDVDGTQVDSGSGNLSGTGSYTVSSYGQHTVALYVSLTGGGYAYPSTTVTLVQPTQTCTVTSYTYKPDGTIYSTINYTVQKNSSNAIYDFVDPNFPTSTWSFDYAIYNGTTYSSVYNQITVSSDSSISIYLKNRLVVCNQYLYLDNIYQTTSQDTGLTPGDSYTPLNHLPWSPSSSVANLVSIIYNGTEYISGGSLTVPNSDFQVDYYYVSVPQGKAYIYATKNGTTQWWPAIPYIYTSSGWQQATPYIYDNGWQ